MQHNFRIFSEDPLASFNLVVIVWTDRQIEYKCMKIIFDSRYVTFIWEKTKNKTKKLAVKQ